MSETAFTQAGIPDPEVDFEGCLQALADAYIEETRGMSRAEQDAFNLRNASERLARFMDERAPDIFLDRAERHLMALLRKRRRERTRTGTAPEPEWGSLRGKRGKNGGELSS